MVETFFKNCCFCSPRNKMIIFGELRYFETILYALALTFYDVMQKISSVKLYVAEKKNITAKLKTKTKSNTKLCFTKINALKSL